MNPTENTLSLYVIFQCHHIEPRSVDSYLSGICSELEQFYPEVRTARKSALVARTLQGAKRLYSKPVSRKMPLARDDVERVRVALLPSNDYDDLLFLAQFLTGFHALLRLGDLVWPDRTDLRSFDKLSRRATVRFGPASFQFDLRRHKSDRHFEGNTIAVDSSVHGDSPLVAFRRYLAARDNLYPCRSELWITRDGQIPIRSGFLRRLRVFFPPASRISGHSLRAGGATALAIAGVPAASIQAIGRWSSESWQVYIRKHPLIVHAMMIAERQQQHV